MRSGVSNITKGLVVDGKKMLWKEVELKYGIDNNRYRKRAYTNPHWPLGKVLVLPLKPAGKMRKRKPGRKLCLEHDPWELERNKIACGRWK